jgi:outer membrane protein assembly factor BamB
MRNRAFDAELKATRGDADLRVPGGFLDGTYFKRVPWRLRADPAYGRLLVHDDRFAYYVRMFDSLEGLNPSVFFTPASKGYLLLARDMEKRRDAWQRRVPVRVRAMVLADGRLIAAGPPDIVDPKDPLAAFEGRKGGVLYVLDTTTGKTLAEHELPSPPVFNGVAAARGKLYLADEAGAVTCFGRRGESFSRPPER